MYELNESSTGKRQVTNVTDLRAAAATATLTTPAMPSDQARAFRAGRHMFIAAGCYEREDRDRAVQHVGLVVDEFEEDHSFARANVDVLEDVANALAQRETARVLRGDPDNEVAQALRERVAALEARLRGAA